MKTIFYLSLMLIGAFSCKTVPISTDTVERLDIIYILFEEGKNQSTSKFNMHKDKPPIENTILYHFKLNKKDYIEFRHKKYLDWDASVAKDSSEIFIKKKSFLKKNIILDYSYFEKTGLIKFYSNLLHKYYIKREYYIIDKAEFKKGKITLRQVLFNSNYELEE